MVSQGIIKATKFNFICWRNARTKLPIKIESIGNSKGFKLQKQLTNALFLTEVAIKTRYNR